MRPRKIAPLVDRFWRFVHPEPNTGCWLWGGARAGKGYGVMGLGRSGSKLEGAHRVSYTLHCGPIGEGLHVLHRCDVPWCVNPDHLFLGTVRQNALDMVRKNRSPKRRLTFSQAQEIARSDEPNRVLARRFGVDECSVLDVRKRRTFREAAEHITPWRKIVSGPPRDFNERRRITLPRDEVIRLRLAGCTLKQIAARFGCSTPVVAKAISSGQETQP